MRRTIAALAAAVLLCHSTVGSAQRPQSPGTIYRAGRGGVTVPKLLHQEKPRYTAGAMHARIEGTVVVECVVLTDGTVGNVRVVRSLDTVYGLDDEAVKAAKEWRFEPGTKDGVPVPVVITIELNFSLGPRPFTSRLPEGFDDSGDSGEGEWREAEAGAAGINVTLRLPPRWMVHPAADKLLLGGQSDAGLGTRMLRIGQPDQTTRDVSRPLDQSALDRVAGEATRSLEQALPGSKFIGAGQGRLANRTWVWIEFVAASPADVAASVPEPMRDIVGAFSHAFDAAHMWLFFTTENQRQITVTCATLLKRDAPDTDRAAEAREAAAEFARILGRLRIEAQP